jgi:signal transduction histidine kinase
VGFETELDRVLELIAKRGRAMSEAHSFLVLLQRDENFQVEAVAGEVSSDSVGTTIPAANSLAGSVAASGVGELVPDLPARVGHGLESIAGDARSLVIVPLGFRGRASGVLIALDRMRQGPAFDAEDEHLLGSFAASAAIAIATAQSVEAERLRHSMRASEEERARWARELHDDTLQELGALKVLLDSARRTGDPDRIQTSIEEALTQIELSIRGLQGLITELRPAALDHIGLVPAVDALVKRVGATSGLDVALRAELAVEEGDQSTRLDPEIERTLYRLTQESLTNAIKHASAGSVSVELTEAGETVTLSVTDDGQGFDTSEISTGFGLVGMRERAVLVGGTLSIESAPGSGTTVHAEIPARHRDAAGPTVDNLAS